MKYKSDFKKYCKYEDEIYKNILFVCLFVCLFDFCHKNDLNYKLNILGPLCLWQCFCMNGQVIYEWSYIDIYQCSYWNDDH